MAKANGTKAKGVRRRKAAPTKAGATPPILPQSRATVGDQSTQCWAHTLAGRRCRSRVSSREGEPVPIPYCEHHLRKGDGALKVVDHPEFGKALVARHDLPPKYRMAYWGIRGRCRTCDVEDRAISFYPPDCRTGTNVDPKAAKEGRRALKTDNYNGVLNPGRTGDVIQFAGCPGPNERQNMRSTFQYYGLRNGILGGLEFVTVMPVPKGTQLLHWYGSGWWDARGIKRRDVGTEKFPAPLRAAAKGKKASAKGGV
ncbi:hypothetical protein ACHAWF_010111 [Thalassiosira exigua]